MGALVEHSNYRCSGSMIPMHFVSSNDASETLRPITLWYDLLLSVLFFGQQDTLLSRKQHSPLTLSENVARPETFLLELRRK